MRGAYRVSVGKPEGRRSLERPRRRGEDNIKIDIREVEWGMDWTDLAQCRGSGKGLSPSQKCLDQLYVPHNLLFSGDKGLFAGSKVARESRTAIAQSI